MKWKLRTCSDEEQGGGDLCGAAEEDEGARWMWADVAEMWWSGGEQGYHGDECWMLTLSGEEEKKKGIKETGRERKREISGTVERRPESD